MPSQKVKATMRAKVRVGSIIPYKDALGGDVVGMEHLSFYGVSKKDGYGDDGLDEDNTFAKFSPNINFNMTVANPALIGKFEAGQEFYVDFIPVKPAEEPDEPADDEDARD